MVDVARGRRGNQGVRRARGGPLLRRERRRRRHLGSRGGGRRGGRGRGGGRGVLRVTLAPGFKSLFAIAPALEVRGDDIFLEAELVDDVLAHGLQDGVRGDALVFGTQDVHRVFVRVARFFGPLEHVVCEIDGASFSLVSVRISEAVLKASRD